MVLDGSGLFQKVVVVSGPTNGLFYVLCLDDDGYGQF